MKGLGNFVDWLCFWLRTPFCGLRKKRRRYLKPPHSSLSGFPELPEHLAGLPKSVIAHRHAAIDRLLQNDLLDIVGREAALGERCAHVHAELFPPPDCHHGADDEHGARALVEMRPRPDLAP